MPSRSNTARCFCQVGIITKIFKMIRVIVAKETSTTTLQRRIGPRRLRAPACSSPSGDLDTAKDRLGAELRVVRRA